MNFAMFLFLIICSTLRLRHPEQPENLNTLRTEIPYQIWKCSAFTNKTTSGWTIPLLGMVRSMKSELLNCRVPEDLEEMWTPDRAEHPWSSAESRELLPELQREPAARGSPAPERRGPSCHSERSTGCARFHFSAVIISGKNTQWLLSSRGGERLTCCCTVPFESVC